MKWLWLMAALLSGCSYLIGDLNLPPSDGGAKDGGADGATDAGE